MPNHEHPVFKPPDDENTPIWRYMDLAQFVSLLDRQALFFCRAAEFSKMDPYEGRVPQENLRLEEEWAENKLRELEEIGTHISDHIRACFGKMPDITQKVHRSIMQVVALNCWHLNEYESAAMWTLYGKKDHAIAVTSTFAKLCNSLKKHENDIIYVGKVSYRDYDKDVIPAGNFFYPILHKRKSFKHENELRAAIFRPPPEWKKEGSSITAKRQPDVFDGNGIYVSCDLDILIDKIYIGPESPDWVLEVVRSIVERFGRKRDVIQKSRIYDAGLY